MSVVEVSVDGGVALLTLNRPERRNAFTADMGRALGEHYATLDTDDSIRVVVVTGAPPAFCAGADFTNGDNTFDAPTDPDFTASPIQPPAFELRKPVIAAINGHAIGIGLTLALQADIRIVADNAWYAIPQVRFGVLPDAVSHWTVTHLAGLTAAAELLLTGRRHTGADLLRLGLANQVLPAQEVLPAALELAHDIATHTAPMSVALCKTLLWDTARDNLNPAQVAARETDLHRRLMGTPDAKEGVRAHLERRPPRWSARLPENGRTIPR
ncbi:enoyl-CoA hydratase/isomerase family protein [Nocardia huaxiensis]|uniref:Enoyl-CoA hydratase/isomerase family protein n=1 Tax=Nocardia huaxiensis TaxID=2755382 RepID=A0A7D6VF82_9NOCA|nr:enoyl-CoA hydratase-related protein [Nocardia huaxiensis]QLY28756.1 enoyl-CoA hydratase/isomerase family protein [Nocardia huaxiensis]